MAADAAAAAAAAAAKTTTAAATVVGAAAVEEQEQGEGQGQRQRQAEAEAAVQALAARGLQLAPTPALAGVPTEQAMRAFMRDTCMEILVVIEGVDPTLSCTLQVLCFEYRLVYVLGEPYPRVLVSNPISTSHFLSPPSPSKHTDVLLVP